MYWPKQWCWKLLFGIVPIKYIMMTAWRKQANFPTKGWTSGTSEETAIIISTVSVHWNFGHYL